MWEHINNEVDNGERLDHVCRKKGEIVYMLIVLISNIPFFQTKKKIECFSH